MLSKGINLKTVKVFVLSILLLLVAVVVTIDKYEDYNPTVIVKTDEFDYQKNKDLLKESKVTGEFKARNNKLGIISVKFNTYNRINDDYLQFSIKEVGNDDWYYSNKYKVDQFQNNRYFPFGFPEINDSKNKIYQIKIESLNGSEGNSVQIIDKTPFLSKYSFSKAYLLENKKEIPGFFLNRVLSFFLNVSVFYYLILLVFSYIYLLFLRLDVFKKTSKFLRKINFLVFFKGLFNKKKKHNKKIEIFLVLLFYLLISIFLTRILFYRNMESQYGDTTFAAQIMTNIGKNFKFESIYARSIVYSFNDIWYKSADYVCNSPLTIPEDLPSGGHFYFIAYPLGLLLRFFNIYWFIAFLQAIVYSSVLLFVYAIARKFKVNIINSILLVLISAQHPLWINGMYGQFYFNRLFLLFSSIIIFLLFNKKLNYFLIALFSLLALSVNEIYGVALFMIFVVYLFLFKFNKKILFYSLFSLLISMFLVYIVKQNSEPNLTQNSVVDNIFSGNLLAIITNIYKNIVSNPSGLFLLVNFVFSGLFILLKPKVTIAWFFFLLPNLILYIGKLGWGTHYHISYFVPVLWLMAYSVSLIKFKKKIFITLVLIGYLIIISRFNIRTYKIDKPNFIVTKMYKEYKNINISKKNILDKFNRLQSSVNKDDKISLPEALSYPLLEHEIFYYPVEIDRVDKVILFYDQSKIGDNRFYSINYGHQDESLDACILSRMRENNFDLDNFDVFDGIVVIDKK